MYTEKISQRGVLTSEERATLAVFAAAMLARPMSMRRHHHGQIDELEEMVRSMESEHGVPAGTSSASREIEAMRPVLHADVIARILHAGFVRYRSAALPPRVRE